MNAHTGSLCQLVPASERLVDHDILPCNAKMAAPDAAILDQPTRHKLCRLAPNREAYPLCLGNDRRVHADNFAAAVYQRTAGIARVQCRIRLNDIVDQAPSPRGKRSPQSAYDSRGHTIRIAERVADGDGDLADPHPAGIGKADIPKPGGVNP